MHECAYYNSISALLRVFRHRKGEHGYIILPTSACNARCTYCYEAGMEPVTMTPDTVEQTIRYIISTHAEEEVHIVWFGGEPLLGEKIIDRISEGLMEAGVPFKSMMISNGSLITPLIIEKMTGLWHLERIQITMDGNESDYISRKCYYKEEDQYHLVMRAIDRMSEKGIRVQVRCNVDEHNWDGLPALLKDMNAIIHHRENVRVYIAPLYQIRESERAMPFWEKVLDAYSMIEKAGFQVKRMVGVGSTFRVNACIADGGGVVICPDGVLSSCEHLQQKAGFGDVWNGVTDESGRNEFCRVDRTREKCRSCPFLPDCTSFSGCPIDASLPVDDLLRYIFEKGNFGNKAGIDGKIATVGPYSTKKHGFFRRLQVGGMKRWKATKKYPILRPFAWIYQSARLLSLMVKSKKSPGEILKHSKHGANQRQMLEKLGLELERTIPQK